MGTLAYSGILWHTLAYSGILWHTLAYSGILWHTLAYSGILRHTLAHSGILWHTLACYAIRSCLLFQLSPSENCPLDSHGKYVQVSNVNCGTYKNVSCWCHLLFLAPSGALIAIPTY